MWVVILTHYVEEKTRVIGPYAAQALATLYAQGVNPTEWCVEITLMEKP